MKCEVQELKPIQDTTHTCLRGSFPHSNSPQAFISQNVTAHGRCIHFKLKFLTPTPVWFTIAFFSTDWLIHWLGKKDKTNKLGSGTLQFDIYDQFVKEHEHVTYQLTWVVYEAANLRSYLKDSDRCISENMEKFLWGQSSPGELWFRGLTGGVSWRPPGTYEPTFGG